MAVLIAFLQRRRLLQDTAYQRRQLYRKANRASTMRSYAKSVRNWYVLVTFYAKHMQFILLIVSCVSYDNATT